MSLADAYSLLVDLENIHHALWLEKVELTGDDTLHLPARPRCKTLEEIRNQVEYTQRWVNELEKELATGKRKAPRLVGRKSEYIKNCDRMAIDYIRETVLACKIRFEGRPNRVNFKRG